MVLSVASTPSFTTLDLEFEKLCNFSPILQPPSIYSPASVHSDESWTSFSLPPPPPTIYSGSTTESETSSTLPTPPAPANTQSAPHIEVIDLASDHEVEVKTSARVEVIDLISDNGTEAKSPARVKHVDLPSDKEADPDQQSLTKLPHADVATR